MYNLDAGEFLKFNPGARLKVFYNREYAVFVACIEGDVETSMVPPNQIGTGKCISNAIKELFTIHNYNVADV